MSRETLGLDPELLAYVRAVALREPDVLSRLRAETAALPDAEMQIAPEQGAFLALLVRSIGARRTLDVGVFTGYSSIAVALALPPGGRVVACELNEERAEIARRWWAEAGVLDRVELRLGPAAGSLDALLAEEGEASFDFAFIDADKEGYVDYWERCVRLVRPGGLIAVDNVFGSGTVADPEETGPYTEAVRRFNLVARDDARVDLALVPIADGVTVARVRAPGDGAGYPSAPQ